MSVVPADVGRRSIASGIFGGLAGGLIAGIFVGAGLGGGLAGGLRPKGGVGPVGMTGPQGAQGNTGPQGPRGDTGPSGNPGQVGPKGPNGFTGSTGADGPPNGPAGVKGEKGPKGQKGPEGPGGGSILFEPVYGCARLVTAKFPSEVIFVNNNPIVFNQPLSNVIRGMSPIVVTGDRHSGFVINQGNGGMYMIQFYVSPLRGSNHWDAQFVLNINGVDQVNSEILFSTNYWICRIPEGATIQVMMRGGANTASIDSNICASDTFCEMVAYLTLVKIDN